jgi:hypothetical protein
VKIINHSLQWGLRLVFLMMVLPALGDPLDHWTIVPSGTTNTLRSVAYGNGMYVVTGDAGTILTSTNGTDWLPAASGITNALFEVCYATNTFVAVGSAGAILTSTNGALWSAQSVGAAYQLNAVTYSDFGFVAVGGPGAIFTSTNGTDWVIQSCATSNSFDGIGAGLGKVYIGAFENPLAYFWSTNGSTWFYLTNTPLGIQPQLFSGGFACGNGFVLGVMFRGQFTKSFDAVNWTLYRSPFFYCFCLTFARAQFVGVGGNFSAGGRTIGTSTNGIDWHMRYSAKNEGRLLGVIYGNHHFVAVGDGGSILISDAMLWFSNPSVMAGGLHLTLDAEPGTIYHVQTTTNLSLPGWNEIGTVTNADEADEIILPYSQTSPKAFYRVTTQQASGH